MRSDIVERVNKVLKHFDFIPADGMTDFSINLAKLGFNSILFIQLIIYFEEEFNVSLDDELDIEKYANIELIIKQIEEKLING